MEQPEGSTVSTFTTEERAEFGAGDPDSAMRAAVEEMDRRMSATDPDADFDPHEDIAPLRRYTMSEAMRDEIFDAPDQSFLLARVAHTHVTPYYSEAGITLCGAFPCSEWEHTPTISPVPHASAHPGDALLEAHADATNPKISIAVIRKYEPTLLCKTRDRYHNREYQRLKRERILALHEKRNAIIDEHHRARVEAARSRKCEPLDDEYRAPDTIQTEEEAQNWRARMAHLSDPPVTKPGIDQAVRSKFRFPESGHQSGQRFAAVVIWDDLTEEAFEDKEPVFAWLRCFPSKEDCDAWIKGGAREYLREYAVQCVDMYEWIFPTTGLRMKIAESYDNPNLDKLAQFRRKNEQEVAAYTRICRRKGIEVESQTVTDNDNREALHNLMSERTMDLPETAVDPTPSLSDQSPAIADDFQ